MPKEECARPRVGRPGVHCSVTGVYLIVGIPVVLSVLHVLGRGDWL